MTQKICIYGVGAIGGWMGARLAAQGAQVSCVARGATLAALREHGLRLIEAGADPEAKDKDGATALILAAGEGQTDAVATLLAKGANPNAHDKLGGTALIWAIGNNRADVVELLLASGADPNQQDTDGVSALIEAVNTSHGDFIGPLLSYRADPSLKDARGRTAMDIARQKGNQEAVTLLSKP